MANVLGILGILVFIAAMIALSAGITWIVVKLSPKPKPKQPAGESST